jgi:hypothetical protein
MKSYNVRIVSVVAKYVEMKELLIKLIIFLKFEWEIDQLLNCIRSTIIVTMVCHSAAIG